MENLKKLIYSNKNPLINNNPSILSQRPQFQLLYEELASIIQTLNFSDQEHDLHELEKVRNLKKRFKDVAEEAQDITDLFVSSVYLKNNEYFTRSDAFKGSLDLADVMRSIKSIKVEITMISHNTKTPTTDSLKMQSAETRCTRNSLGTKRVVEDIVVGIDADAMVIVEKLTEDQKQLDVVSIVGMGGLGKTTLATKVFNHHFIAYHFHSRAWITVSQAYQRRVLVIQLLSSMGVKLDHEEVSDSKLKEMLHKRLMGRRYLIVVDDIWSSDAWDDLKLCLRNDNTGSRILLTTRLKDVALHAKSHGFIHHLKHLTQEESWELLHKKVFQGKEECPEWLRGVGMRIARNCHGLPLAVVVIAGVLAKEAISKDSWEKIARCASSYFVGDGSGLAENLALSYDHLPRHLKDCFLYLGGFPEDYKFRVPVLGLLWMAEGFIQEAGNKSMEETGEDYLMELVDRNILIVADRKFDGGIKTCVVHDLLRELCLEKATQENFCMKIDSYDFATPYNKQRRIFMNNFSILNSCGIPTPGIRSFLGFHSDTYMIYNTCVYLQSCALLMVLDLLKCQLPKFPPVIGLLVHLRYLGIPCSEDLPSSICNLWSLQTLIVSTSRLSLGLPKNISDLVNLRHLWSNGGLCFPSIQKPMNLQTISSMVLRDGDEGWLKCLPGIKKLTCRVYPNEENDFESLRHLETLKLTASGEPNFQKNHISLRFPTTLKRLTLAKCGLPWSHMSIIQWLPILEVMKLLENAFVGPWWDTGEEQFRQLQFLKLEDLDIQQWEASSINFPRLKRLTLKQCNYLKEIPLGIGDISTLELIQANDCSDCVVESLDRIREDQQAVGNYELKIDALYRQRVRLGPTFTRNITGNG